eukprot:s815_g11.t1
MVQTCPLLGQIVRKFCIRLAVRRAFVAEANRRAGLDEAPKRQGAILVRKSVIPSPVTIPPAQELQTIRGSDPGERSREVTGSIPGSSPRSIAESKAESIQDEPGDVVALSDEDGADEVQVESAKVCGELAEARARIFHTSD